MLTLNDFYLFFILRVMYFTDKHPTRQFQSTYQNTRQTLGFQKKNILSKIPPVVWGVCFWLLALNISIIPEGSHHKTTNVLYRLRRSRN